MNLSEGLEDHTTPYPTDLNGFGTPECKFEIKINSVQETPLRIENSGSPKEEEDDDDEDYSLESSYDSEIAAIHQPGS